MLMLRIVQALTGNIGVLLGGVHILSQFQFHLLGSNASQQATFIPRDKCVINFFSPKGQKSRMRHLLGTHPPVEILLTEVSKSQSGLLETGPFFVRFLGDLGGFVVADVRIQSGY